jgi:hypothetical protein
MASRSAPSRFQQKTQNGIQAFLRRKTGAKVDMASTAPFAVSIPYKSPGMPPARAVVMAI